MSENTGLIVQETPSAIDEIEEISIPEDNDTLRNIILDDNSLPSAVDYIVSGATPEQQNRRMSLYIERAKELDIFDLNKTCENRLIAELASRGLVSNKFNFNYDNTGVLTERNMKHALTMLQIKARFNVISHKLEVTGKSFSVYGKGNHADKAATKLEDILSLSLKKCTVERIERLLQIIGAENRYNPILEKINATQWDGKDRITELYGMIGIPAADWLSKALIKKWLMQAYCGLHNELPEPIPLDAVLVLSGNQGYGKTRLLEKLFLGTEYFGEGVHYSPDDKDMLIQATSKWGAELAEIDHNLRPKDIPKLKSFISSRKDEYRVPYGRASVEHPRITTFCATTNPKPNDGYLADETGNRRWWTVPFNNKLDIGSKQFKDFDVLQLWSQISSIVENERKTRDCDYKAILKLTPEESDELDKRNKMYMSSLKGEQEVRDILGRYESHPECYELVDVTHFIESHKSELGKYSASDIGKVLAKIGIEQKRVKNSRCYNLPMKNPDNISMSKRATSSYK